ncbi:trypsin-like peptidase domain-containing protein [Micromonospora aurantiaca (nom. illeg.)]|uniref:trypsin-like peptidase domain-containing protein n=1 Tax=Micromonospora aurantiaca (nom. illeg.) TaxID=47850 RepID=UPI00082755AD|nr:trypsin-like peptidase domain-containing protein [Micromonospora aurantiaca]SCL33579.1 Trypsin-like peptidase domain-containing protein [Micromonospora aurantiaca]
MTGGYGTGDDVPGHGGGDTAADRPGPLPPRFAPPAGSAPVPGSFPGGSEWAGTPGYPARAAVQPPAGYPGLPDPAGTPQPTPYAAPSGVATPPATAQPGQPGQPSYGTTPSEPGRSSYGSAPAQPSSFGAVPAQTSRSAAPAYPGQPAASPAYPGQPAASPAYPGQPVSASPAYPGQPVSASPSYPGGPGSSSYPGPSGSGPSYPGQPVSAPAYPGQPVSAPSQPGSAYPGQAAPVGGPAGFGAQPARRSRVAVVALALAAVLTVVTGVQAYQIYRLDDRLAAADKRMAEGQGTDASRLDGLEQRAGSLEKKAGAAFNPEAVASAVLPSVFRVRAGQFTGTAFAVGKAPSGGGTTLLTNFHVVESVFTAGERKVFLERKDQRFEATIIATDKDKDLAQLQTTAKFTGLVAARDPVRSGQQIIVVGAPLGLQDSVTTGVVSAFREDERGGGPVIQFDAPINPGNSGGPVINGSKEVVGIATAKARNAEGIGLAVPIKTACDRFRLC